MNGGDPLSPSLTEQLALRKEVNLKKKALKGVVFKGSGEIRAEAKKIRHHANKQGHVTRKENSPVEVFKRSHLGLTQEEYEILLSKGKDLEDLPLNKDGTACKRFLSGGEEGCFKNRMKELRKKYRREGLPEKTEQATNHQPRTIKNPLGAGGPVQQVDLPKQLKTSTNILECTARVLPQVQDWEALPGFYDTKYTPETKIHACTAYLVTGSFSKASKYSAVPESTIKSWRGTEWFRTVARYIQAARQEELDIQMSDVIHQSIGVVQDRLQNGDAKYNPKTGEIVQIPIQAKDAALIADKIIKNRNLLRGDATSRTDNSSLAEKIMDLRQQFKSFSQPKVIEAERVPEEERE